MTKAHVGVPSLPNVEASAPPSILPARASSCAPAPGQEQTGLTPLAAAASRGHMAVVDVLLAHGADIDLADKVRLGSSGGGVAVVV